MIINKIHGKKNIDIKNDNRGMTMVEVLMGFTVLMIILGGLSSIISFSSNMYMNCADMRHAMETFQSELYKNEKISTNGVVSTTPIKFTCKVSGDDTYKSSANSKMYSYTMESGQFVDAATNENIDMKFYYVGPSAAGGTP